MAEVFKQPTVDSALDADGGPLWYYLDMILRRKLAALLVAAVVMAVATLYVNAVQPVYRSKATIEVFGIKKEADKVTGEQAADLTSSDYLATQLEILKSQALAQAVVDKYDLSGLPEFTVQNERPGASWWSWLSGICAGWVESDGIRDKSLDNLGSREKAAKGLLSRITVKQVRRSNILEISGDASSPVLAQELLTKYVTAYIDRNLERRRSESLEGIGWLKEELAKQTNKLQDSERAWLEFSTDNNIVSKQDGGLGHVLSVVNRSLDSLSRLRETRIKAETLNELGSRMPGEILPQQQARNEYVQGLRQQLVPLETQYLQLSGVYSPEYPTLSMLKKKIHLLKTKIDEIEKEALLASVETAASEEGRLQEVVNGASTEARRLNALEAEYVSLKRAVDMDREFCDLIQKQIKALQVRVGTISNNVSLVDAPSRAEKLRPKVKKIMAIAFATALLLGVCAAFVAERSDRRVRSWRDVDEVLKLPKLGFVPNAAGLTRFNHDRLKSDGLEFAAYDFPASPISDAIRSVQTSMALVTAGSSVRSLMLTSASPGEGKTYLAVSIASVLQCGNGRKTLLIDADLRRPKIHKVFGETATSPGLSTILYGKRVPLSQVIHRHRIPGLFYMTSGPAPDDPVAALQSARLVALLSSLGKHFDYLVIDCPPVLGFPDTTIISQYADAVILVARDGVVTRRELRDAYDSLALCCEDKIVGVVLNGVTSRGIGYGYGGYYYSRNDKYYGKKRSSSWRNTRADRPSALPGAM